MNYRTRSRTLEPMESITENNNEFLIEETNVNDNVNDNTLSENSDSDAESTSTITRESASSSENVTERTTHKKNQDNFVFNFKIIIPDSLFAPKLQGNTVFDKMKYVCVFGSKFFGSAVMVSLFMTETTNFSGMSFLEKSVSIVTPGVTGYIFGEYITPVYLLSQTF